MAKMMKESSKEEAVAAAEDVSEKKREWNCADT